jgi:L-fuculose-phosphate aldolase
MKYKKQREEIVTIGRKLYETNMISGSEGNISIRLEKNLFLVTPSGVNKGELKNDDLVIVDDHGNVVLGELNVSSEFLLHLEFYKKRPDVNAVIHCHPIHCISLMLAGITLNRPYLPEMVVTLGSVPTAPYATPSTEEVPKSISKLVEKTDVILLDHHGAVVGTENLRIAMIKMETLEHAATSIVQAYLLRNRAPRTLNKQKVKKLIGLRANKYKIPGKFLDEYIYS